MRRREIIRIVQCLLATMAILATLASPAQPPNYSFRHITQSDGLINSKVDFISQDKRGFIWIGTENGLQRYDGTRFVTFSESLNPDNRSNLKMASLVCREDRLVMNIDGIFKKLDLLRNKIDPINDADIRQDLLGKQVFKEPDGQEWALGSYFIYGRTGPGTKWKAYISTQAIDTVRHQIWVIADGYPYGLILLDRLAGKACSIMKDPKSYAPLAAVAAKAGLRKVAIDGNHHLWFNTWGEIFYRYDLKTNTVKKYHLSTDRRNAKDEQNRTQFSVNCIFADDHGQVWLATSYAGLQKYDSVKDRFDQVLPANDPGSDIRYNYEIFNIFQDRDGNIWLGTDNGINIFNPYQQYFVRINHKDGYPISLPKRDITGVIETEQGEILVGTWGAGISIFDDQWHFKKNITFAGSFDKNLVWCFQNIDKTKIWIGCQHGIILSYDLISHRIDTLKPPELQGSTIMCMARDKHGNIFFGLYNGKVALWSAREKAFFACHQDSQSEHPLRSQVHKIYADAEGNCWAATENGLKLFDPEKKGFMAVYTNGKDQARSSLCIEPYNDSTLLIGWVNGGISLFNKRTGINSFPWASQLPLSTVYAIRKDGHQNIWFTTDYNIYKFNPREQRSVSYSMEPGLINSCFYSNEFQVLKDGRWVTHTSTEIICFCPDSLLAKASDALPVEITGLKLFDKSIFIDSFIHKNQPIEFNYHQNFLTIEFATLNFSRIRQITYVYRLTGVDPEWVNAGTSGKANYTNLPPGRYLFSVMAKEGKGKDGVASFSFIIAPPFWQTWEFRTACALLLICLIYFTIKWRIRAIRHEAVFKQQIAETEMMALRAQMNPHFIFNCINGIDALIQNNDKYSATVYLNKFARLIRNILDSSRQDTVTLSKDLETLKLYIEMELFRNEGLFKYEINIENDLVQEDFRVPPLIIQPFVENAILHGLRYKKGTDGRLFVGVRHQNGYLTYLIEDNGIGRQARSAGQPKGAKSYGIEMTCERLKLFNKENKALVEITDLKENGLQAGTKVEVFLKTN